MGEKKYKLRFLPLFVDDLTEITDYIANTLNNPHAANKLVDAVEKAINERLPFAESFEPFPSKNERKFPYYRISVRNFTVYYVVIDDVMEVRRILYSRRNISKLLMRSLLNRLTVSQTAFSMPSTVRMFRRRLREGPLRQVER